MKQIINLSKLFFFLAFVGFFLTSCEPETFVDNPTASLSDDTGYVSVSETVGAGETFKVLLTATNGSGEMNTLTIQKDGDDLSTTSFTIDGVADNNAKLLFDGDRTSFEYEIEITSGVDAGTSTYSFIIASLDGGSVSESVEITVESSAPTLVNSMNSSITIENPGTVKIVVVGAKGSSALNSISVSEEGALITDLTRLEWGDVDFDANPYLLLGDDKDGFTEDLWLKSNNIIGTTNYTITLTDENGNESTINYAITIEPLTTDITIEYLDVTMYNNAGPSFGAIDLATGTNVSSGDNTADLGDVGIDGDGLWRQQINGLNGASLRSIEAGVTYDGVTTIEALTAAYDAGTELVETGTLDVGSTYAAKQAGIVYLITVASVVPTGADNNDYYTFNIKKGE